MTQAMTQETPLLILRVRFKLYLSKLGVNKKLHGCVEGSPHLSFSFQRPTLVQTEVLYVKNLQK